MRHRKAFLPLAYDFPLMYQTTQKSKDMLTQNERKSPISVQIFALIAQHGLENVAQNILHLCNEQLHLHQDDGIEDSIKHLEKLIDSSCRIQNWK